MNDASAIYERDCPLRAYGERAWLLITESEESDRPADGKGLAENFELGNSNLIHGVGPFALLGPGARAFRPLDSGQPGVASVGSTPTSG